MATTNGGGIYNKAFNGTGTLTIIASTLSDNSASSGSGGGIAIVDGAVALINSTLSPNSSGNSGGGILTNGRP